MSSQGVSELMTVKRLSGSLRATDERAVMALQRQPVGLED